MPVRGGDRRAESWPLGRAARWARAEEVGRGKKEGRGKTGPSSQNRERVLVCLFFFFYSKSIFKSIL